MKLVSYLKASSGTALALSAVFLAAGVSQASAAANCMPKVEEGPVPITAVSQPYLPPSNPYAGATPPGGEMQEEFFISCDVAGGHYKTVIHVTLPTDASKQSGIVIAEPWHPQDFWTIYDKARKYITRTGDVSVVIVASNFVLESFLKKGNPARYARLTIPGRPANGGRGAGGGRRGAGAQRAGAGGGGGGILAADDTQSEILGQVGAFIKNGGIPGVKARKVILGGMSATGGVVRQYILYEHAQPGARSVYDGYFPEQAAGTVTPMADLDVPVVELQGERELKGELRSDGPIRFLREDAPLFRLYEVAGSPHIATRMATQLPGEPVPTNRVEPGIPDCVGHTWTNFPTDMVYAAALDDLVQWVDKGVAPPHIARIAMVPKAREIQRDQYGNAIGGFRTTYLDVPIATYHATWGNFVRLPDGTNSDPMAQKCDFIGWTTPLPAATLKKLYPTHAVYVAKVAKDAAELVRKHELMPEDAAVLNQEARESDIP